MWINRSANLTLNLDNNIIIFSYHNYNNKCLNYIMVFAKQYIYKKNKFLNNKLNLNVFISKLRTKLLNERYIAHINDKMASFFSKWGPLYNYFWK